MISPDQSAAEAALAIVRSALEAELPEVKAGPVGPRAPDGELYREIASFGNGVRGHGTAAEAIAEWRLRLKSYAEKHDGNRLWWREPPEIFGDMHVKTGTERWRVYSRLRIGWEPGT